MKPYPETPPGLDVERHEGELRLRFNRPERRNSLTDPIVYALIDIIDAAASDESVRVIHITGAGEHFCSGFDLGERPLAAGGCYRRDPGPGRAGHGRLLGSA